jgi:acyl dehydratase
MPRKLEVKLAKGTWEEAQTYVGKIIGTKIGADKVEEGTIRRRLETIEFDCPLHYDDEAAKKAGYKGIIAPSTMVLTYVTPAYWKPGDPHTKPDDPLKAIALSLADVPAEGKRTFASDVELEFFAPMYIGDRISCEDKLLNLIHKEIRVGKGAFMVQESTYKNQRGELVAIMRMSMFRYDPPEEKGEQSNV